MQPIPVVRHSAMPAPANAARQSDSSAFADLLNQQLVNSPSAGPGRSDRPAEGKPNAPLESSPPRGVGQATPEASVSTQVGQTGRGAAQPEAKSAPAQSTVTQPPPGDGQSPVTGWPTSLTWTALVTGGTHTAGNQESTSPPGGSSIAVKKTSASPIGSPSAALVSLPAGLMVVNLVQGGGADNRANTVPSPASPSNPAMSLAGSAAQPGAATVPAMGLLVSGPEAGTVQGSGGVAQLDTAVSGVTTKPAHAPSPDAANSLLSTTLPVQSAPTNVPSLTVSTPVGANPAWGSDVAQHVIWMVGQQQQAAELQLNPPNLGPLTVVIQMAGNQANAFFSSPHAAVRDALQHALPHLSEMLAGSGLSLGQATVSDQRSGSGYPRGSSSSRSWDNLSSRNVVSEVSSGMSAARSVMTRVGLIDTFA